MSSFPTVRIAAIQATPVILDAEATVEKTVRLLNEAADEGVQLAVLPETFVPLYPSGTWAHNAATFTEGDELWQRLWDNSVDVEGPHSERIATVCRERGIHCVIGINEREDARPGSLYNSFLLFGPGGLLHRHRKLMPTNHERLFHGVGAGNDLAPVETPIGTIGGLICWENRMPLARYIVYQGGPQIWVAPTADDSDVWQSLMRTIAVESGAFVVSAPQYIPANAFPDDFPVELPQGKEKFGRGGAAIYAPGWGEVVAGPLYDQEGMVVADCDLRAGLRAKRLFDSVGHYSRSEVLHSLIRNDSVPAGEPGAEASAEGP